MRQEWTVKIFVDLKVSDEEQKAKISKEMMQRNVKSKIEIDISENK